MSDEGLVEGLDTAFGNFEDRLNSIKEAQAAYDHLNSDDQSYQEGGVEGLEIGSEGSEHITEVYQDAHDESVSVYEWGDGEEAQQFILEESVGMEDQDTAYRSRVIQEEGATYHLIQEKEEGDTNVAMRTSGTPSFDVENQEDFERVWAQLQGQDAELSNPNSLSQDVDYSAKGEHYRQ